MSGDIEDDWSLWDASSAEQVEDGITVAKAFLAELPKAQENAEEV
jgi:hypothetical protein